MVRRDVLHHLLEGVADHYVLEQLVDCRRGAGFVVPAHVLGTRADLGRHLHHAAQPEVAAAQPLAAVQDHHLVPQLHHRVGVGCARQQVAVGERTRDLEHRLGALAAGVLEGGGLVDGQVVEIAQVFEPRGAQLLIGEHLHAIGVDDHHVGLHLECRVAVSRGGVGDGQLRRVFLDVRAPGRVHQGLGADDQPAATLLARAVDLDLGTGLAGAGVGCVVDQWGAVSERQRLQLVRPHLGKTRLLGRCGLFRTCH